MLFAQGESPKYVSDQLGHSSVQITFDIYGHLFPQAKAEASEKFEGRMLRAREQASVSKLLASEEDNRNEKNNMFSYLRDTTLVRSSVCNPPPAEGSPKRRHRSRLRSFQHRAPSRVHDFDGGRQQHDEVSLHLR